MLEKITSNNALFAKAVEKGKSTDIMAKVTSSKLQPQLFSLILVTLILVVLSIVIYTKVKKQKATQAPEGFLLVAEQYVMGVDNLFKDATGGAINKPAPYILTLMTLLLFSNLIGLLGIEPPSTSYSFTFTLALISWIGIYVVGIMSQKLSFFKKFYNPVELIGQFAPLISLSFRLFGNMIGGSTIMYLIYSFTGWIWGMIPVIGEVNLFGSIIAPVFHFYFDIFDGVIQAFVFTLLSMVYWTLEASHGSEEPQKEVVVKADTKNTLKLQKTK